MNKQAFNKQKSIINKNSYVGRTYRVNDNDLPHTDEDTDKIVNFIAIEENGQRLGGVRTTTKNTRSFIPKHRLYNRYRTFLEIHFQDGSPIKADDIRLQENPWKNNLNNEQIENVQNELYNHSKQSSEIRRKRDELKSSKNKKK